MAAASASAKANALARSWRPDEGLNHGPAIDTDDDAADKKGSRRNSANSPGDTVKQQVAGVPQIGDRVRAGQKRRMMSRAFPSTMPREEPLAERIQALERALTQHATLLATQGGSAADGEKTLPHLQPLEA